MGLGQGVSTLTSKLAVQERSHAEILHDHNIATIAHDDPAVFGFGSHHQLGEEDTDTVEPLRWGS
jgi:hypothetical protein